MTKRAINETREALEESNLDLGIIEAALMKVKEASDAFTKAQDVGVSLENFIHIDKYGAASDIQVPRDVIDGFKTELLRKKHNLTRTEKDDLEKKKTMAQVAREGLKQAEIPNLLVTEKYTNIVDFIEITYKRYLAITKNSPQHIGAFLDTMKQKCGPLKEAVQYLQTLPEIYRTISNSYMQGIEGIKRLFSYNRTKSETALDSYRS